MEDPRLEAIRNQIDTIWLVLERPVVQRQLGAFVFVLFFSWLFPLLLRRALDKVIERRKAQRKGARPVKPTWQFELIRWAKAIEYTFFPLLGLILGQVVVVLFEGTGWRTGLLQRVLPLFWLLLVYRILAGLLSAVFAPPRSQRYQWRFLVPISLILTIFILGSGLESTFPIGEVILVTLLETPVTLRALFTASIILYFFITLAWLMRDLISRLFLANSEYDHTASSSVLTLSHYVVIGIGIISAIGTLGFNLSALALIGGGLSVGIGFGLQELVANFISGILLLFERTVRPGDMIEVGGQRGVVDQLRMRATVIRTADNTDVFVPNKNLLTSAFVAYTQTDRVIQRILRIGVSYGSDPTKVRDILLGVAHRHGLVLKKPEPVVFFIGFGASSLDFDLAISVNDPSNAQRVVSDLYFMIWNEFNKHGVEIPFPQQELHLRGIPWEKLAQVTPNGDGTKPQPDDSKAEAQPIPSSAELPSVI